MRISDWSSDVCSSDLLAAWRATHGKEAAAASAASPTAEGVAADNPGTGAGWRIQIGAYTGRKAADEAWEQVRREAPGLAAYRPYLRRGQGVGGSSGCSSAAGEGGRRGWSFARPLRWAAPNACRAHALP